MGSLSKKIRRSMREQATGKRMSQRELEEVKRRIEYRKILAQREATRIKYEKEAVEERFAAEK